MFEFEWFRQMLTFIATALGLVQAPNAAALGLAIALIAITVLVIALAIALIPFRATGDPHPRRAIGLGVTLSQSHPDAAGHPRPRAPGVAVAA